MSNTNPAVVVYVKIGADNSIEILDSIPASATLTTSSFYNIIKNDITSDTYIAMDISETCSNDDSCIQYNGTNYSMDLQNSANILNKPLDTNFLKVKDSATNASSPLKEEEGGEEFEGEVEVKKEEGVEGVEGEVKKKEEEKVGEGENKSLEDKIKEEIPEKKK